MDHLTIVLCVHAVFAVHNSIRRGCGFNSLSPFEKKRIFAKDFNLSQKNSLILVAWEIHFMLAKDFDLSQKKRLILRASMVPDALPR